MVDMTPTLAESACGVFASLSRQGLWFCLDVFERFTNAVRSVDHTGNKEKSFFIRYDVLHELLAPRVQTYQDL
jgi:hypothetical protein